MPATPTACTLFCVIQLADLVTGEDFLQNGNFANGVGMGASLNGAGHRNVCIPGHTNADTSTLATTSWELWTLTQNANVSTLRINGTQVFTGTTATPVTGGLAYCVLGARQGTQMAKANMFGAQIYNSVLGPTDLAYVEAYYRTLTSIW